MDLFLVQLLKNQRNIFITFLNIIAFLYIIKPGLLEYCDYNHPFRKNGECTDNRCTEEEYQSGHCYIENEIIKTQRITNKIKYSEGGAIYSNLATTPKGDLICISSFYEVSTKKFFYGIKNNGRPYFNINNIETCFNEIDCGTIRNEGNIYAIQLNGGDKEYIVSFGANNAYFEIYDFEDNNRVYKQLGTSFFGTQYNNFNYASIFKLNDDINYYIISFIAQNSYSSKTFYIMKFLFNNLNIGSYNNPSKTSINLRSADTISSSCFLSENDYIICFYLDNYKKYMIIAYSQDLVSLGSTFITSTYFSNKDFYKCAHFTTDAGAFIYLDTDKNIAIQFKIYNSGNFKDFFNSNTKIKINNNNYIADAKTSDMIRLSDKRICAAFLTSNYEELDLYVINNYSEEKIKIRHYNIKVFKFYGFYITDELNLNLYNDFLSMAFVIYESNNFGTFLIFSYANSIDFSIDITNNLISFSNPIIKLYEKCKIENNIFGYIFEGFQIYNFSEGINLLKLDNQEEIIKNEILPNNTDIELIINKDIKIEGNRRIEYRMVIIEPEYEIYNQYPIETIKSYCGGVCNDDIDNYNTQKLSHFGRISYLDITFDLNKISNDCNENCAICNKDNDKSCIICRYSSISLPIGTIKCLAEDELTTTIITTIPTTIITTLPTTIITKIPTTIITTIPTTIIITIPTTIITTIPSTIIITIPTTIITTIPTTKITTIPTTIITIIPTTIITAIPTTIIATIPTTIITTIPTTIITTIPTTFITTIPTTIITTIPKIEITNLITLTEIENKSNNDITNSIQTEIEKTANKYDEENKKYEKYCSYEEILYNKCIDGEMTLDHIEYIKKTLINSNYTKENTIIKTKNVIVQLSTLEAQKNSDNPDISNIDFGECENILKAVNNIPMDESLIIFKADINKEDNSSKYVTYEVYNPITLEKLDLNICNNNQIKIRVPVIVEDEIKLLIISLSELGYNLFDEEDCFYNDICSTFTSKNGTDILLSDRKKDFYSVGQNQSLCQNSCELKSYIFIYLSIFLFPIIAFVLKFNVFLLLEYKTISSANKLFLDSPILFLFDLLFFKLYKLFFIFSFFFISAFTI